MNDDDGDGPDRNRDRDGTGMREGRSGGGSPGRRQVHPGDTAPGSPTPVELETLLAAAVRDDVDPYADQVLGEGEQRAVAAFRAARDAGAHRARTRRRDDWRPRERRRLTRSLRTTLSVFAASLTVGGVAFAAIGTGGPSSTEAEDRIEAHTSAPARPDTAPSAEGPSPRPDRPDTAQDTKAHCRTYERVRERGALDSTAWQRLVEAAGGEGNVATYCARRLAATETKGTESKGTADQDNGGQAKGQPKSQGRSGTAGGGEGAGKGENKGAGDSGPDQPDTASGKKKR
ncbi:hypothetical protein [Streptomyces sp. NPDC020489]|uniref:hypothetical protein n=1 Tax=Streptomyces sp. NPDC020489 TaxID=3365077 RepID=UPI0037A8ADD4